MNRPRVLVADDHRMFAEALKSLLAPRCQVVGTVTDGRALLEAAAKLQPDVILLDVEMPQMNGFTAGRELMSRMPRTKIIFLTMHEDPYLVAEAFRAGASAFLLKETEAAELFEAIETVMKGGNYVTPSAAKGLETISLRDPKTSQHEPELTPRQREVVQLLAEGLSMKQVAEVLKISLRTVEAHKYAVMELMQLKTNADLFQFAVKHHLVSVWH